MNGGISINEACRFRALTPDDFARSCNEDGTVKYNTETTTFYLKRDNSKSITVNNTILQISLVAVVLTITVLATVLVIKLRKNKK